ncbi:MAG TPA: NAD(P)-binding domain-containing protein [Polyangiaceae bacterium]|nr:NAD(P)-binding domain-containing protein [Polyangiaceae bacterium]
MSTSTPAQGASLAVIGAGTWGLALAAAAARAGTSTVLFSRRGEVKPPKGVTLTKDLAVAASRAHLLILAVPSSAAEEVARQLGDHVDGRHFVVHGVRGLANDGATGLRTVSDVVRAETPVHRVGALGGPALMADLRAGKPGVLLCGSAYDEVNRAVHAAFNCRTLRCYTTHDLRGLEWGSALVGCLAIGIGYAQALDMSPGLVAAVISRSIEEASRIAAAAGGEERTMLGLAGYGDLLACIAQKERPEVRVGAALAKGMSLDKAVKSADLRVEAVELIPRVNAWADEHHVRAPIFAALRRLVYGESSPEKLIEDLMTYDR